ncbi:hypothetical protein NDU88_001596 [Pleurodeles waltl]|uniref:Uncharacterized protein n=1 Tax=Pleurodeles waltl TaxID=8319 RepID=A0AAV7SZM8_PLEWA|nr:hypothetical protein NDU88_001596 [Pleurodeles waltl]
MARKAAFRAQRAALPLTGAEQTARESRVRAWRRACVVVLTRPRRHVQAFIRFHYKSPFAAFPKLSYVIRCLLPFELIHSSYHFEMVQFAEEDDYYQDIPIRSEEIQMEERLVEAF